MEPGLERPDSGKVRYSCKKLRVGYIPDRFPKDIRFTPMEYLSVGKINGMASSCLYRRLPALLARFQLDRYSNQRIHKLSKGNIQKVAIIQAVLQQPELLIMDEPVSGLDFSAQQELLLLIKELKEQGTAFLLLYIRSFLTCFQSLFLFRLA